MKQLLEYVIPNIVNHPEDVVITEENTGEMTRLLIKVNPEDIGRVIGKSGKVIKAIRQLVRVLAIKQGVRVVVDVADGQDESVVPQDQSTEEPVQQSSDEGIDLSETK